MLRTIINLITDGFCVKLALWSAQSQPWDALSSSVFAQILSDWSRSRIISNERKRVLSSEHWCAKLGSELQCFTIPLGTETSDKNWPPNTGSFLPSFLLRIVDSTRMSWKHSTRAVNGHLFSRENKEHQIGVINRCLSCHSDRCKSVMNIDMLVAFRDETVPLGKTGEGGRDDARRLTGVPMRTSKIPLLLLQRFGAIPCVRKASFWNH